MQKNEVHQFLEQYFTALQCTILEQTSGSLSVKLTPEIDKELMNRPFYWHYAEKMGKQGVPLTLTLLTNKEQAPPDLKGEVVHFGAPRLQQIFKSAKQHARFIKLYEQVESRLTEKQQPLHPWLLVNFKISYQADRKKDMFYSYGLNLINGIMKEDFMYLLTNRSLTASIPDFSFTITPMIKPKSGVMRLQQFLSSKIESKDHSWSQEARKRWAEDLALLNHFFEDEEEKPEAYFIEQSALQKQYEPVIEIDIINGGIIYLVPSV